MQCNLIVNAGKNTETPNRELRGNHSANDKVGLHLGLFPWESSQLLYRSVVGSVVRLLFVLC